MAKKRISTASSITEAVYATYDIPEKQLLAQLLRLTLRDLRSEKRRKADEALAYVSAQASSAAFNFEAVCDYLGLDVHYTRSAFISQYEEAREFYEAERVHEAA